MRPEEYERAFGGEERQEWIRWQPSVVTGGTPCVAAHVRGGGTSRRADACWTVPMLYCEHQEMHNVGQETYAALHGLDLDALAIETDRRYREYLQTRVKPAW